MKTKTNDKVLRIALAGLFAAFTTIATMLVQIPTPTKGYVNLGDTFVNISAWVLGPVYGSAAAGIGSMLADVFAGYMVYAPATLVIKALMGLASALTFVTLSKKLGSLGGRIVAAVAAELIMVFGYFAFESVLYGSVAAAAPGMPANIVQGLMGAIISVTLFETVLKRLPFLKDR